MLSGIEFAPLRFFLVGAAIIMCFQILTDTLLLINATVIKRELGCLGGDLIRRAPHLSRCDAGKSGSLSIDIEGEKQ